MTLRLTLLLLVSLTLGRALSGQTTVLARPASDAKGLAVFQIVKIVRVEGEWEKPLVVGDLVYPQKRERAYPLSRFGESVVITFTESNHREIWQGLHVHNGYIPALNGLALTELMDDIAARPMPVEEPHEHTEAAAASNEALTKYVCPVCHQVHLRI